MQVCCLTAAARLRQLRQHDSSVRPLAGRPAVRSRGRRVGLRALARRTECARVDGVGARVRAARRWPPAVRVRRPLVEDLELYCDWSLSNLLILTGFMMYYMCSLHTLFVRLEWRSWSRRPCEYQVELDLCRHSERPPFTPHLCLRLVRRWRLIRFFEKQ